MSIDWVLNINGQPIELEKNLAGKPRVFPISLTAQLNQAQVFTLGEDRKEFGTNLLTPTFSKWSLVELYYQGTRVFWGRVFEIQYPTRPGSPPIIYTCYGPQAFAAMVDVTVSWGIGQMIPNLSMGDQSLRDSIMEPENLSDTPSAITFSLYYPRLRRLIPWLLSQNSDNLSRWGLTSQINLGNLANDNAKIDQWEQYINRSLTDVILSALEHAPRYRIIIDCATMTWHVVDVLNMPLLRLPNKRWAVWDIRESVIGCATTVKLHTLGSGFNSQAIGTLSPAWDERLEETWTIDRANSTMGETQVEGNDSFVFRRFSYSNIPDVLEDMPMEAQFDYHALDKSGSGTTKTTKYHTIKIAQVDTKTKTIMLDQPAVRGSQYNGRDFEVNLKIPGKAQLASNVKLVYYRRSGVPPTTKTAGPNGKFYSIVGNEVVRNIYLESSDYDMFTPQDFLDLIKDPFYTGNVAFFGPPPVESWLLDKKFSFYAPNSVDIIDAFVAQMTYDFSSDQTSLSISTDLR